MAIEMSSNELKDLFMNLYMEKNESLRAKLFPTVPNIKNLNLLCPFYNYCWDLKGSVLCYPLGKSEENDL